MRVGVVRAVAASVPDIVRLIGELRVQEELSPTISDESVRAYLAEAQTEVLVAVASGVHEGGWAGAGAGAHGASGNTNDAVVGLLTLRMVGDLFHDGASALVQELIVDAGWRGRGVGGALLDAAVDHARKRGCAEIGVSTGVQNRDAQALYRSRGFEAEGLWLERHLDE